MARRRLPAACLATTAQTRSNRRPLAAALTLMSVGAAGSAAHAQPFDTVINVPPDPAPTEITAPNTQVNFTDGAVIPSGFRAGGEPGVSTNIEVNVTGGGFAAPEPGNFRIFDGATLNLENVVFGEFARVAGGEVTIRSGGVGDFFDVHVATVNVSGGVVGDFLEVSDSTLRVGGGVIGNDAEVVGISRVEIAGGFVGENLRVTDRLAEVTISGGRVGRSFFSEAPVTLSGGTILPGMEIRAPLVVRGGEFRQNGQPVSGPVNFLDGLITGTLEDGSVFIFAFDRLREANIELVATSVPDRPDVINAPADPIPAGGLRPGQTLNLAAGGVLTGGEHVGATVRVGDGGQIFPGASFADSLIELNRGASVGGLSIFGDSELNIRPGADLGGLLMGGSLANMTGGRVGPGSNIGGATTFNLSGGSIGERFEVRSEESAFNLSGGTVGRQFDVRSGTLNIRGDNFVLNGEPVSGVLDRLSFSEPPSGSRLPPGFVLTGTLEDGSVFLFTDLDEDMRSFAEDSRIVLTPTNAPEVTQPVIRAPADPIPAGGVRAGQTLVLDGGARTRDGFEAVGGTIRIHAGGALGDDVNVAGTQVELLEGGRIGERFKALIDSSITIRGGEVQGEVTAVRSDVVITGGTVQSLVLEGLSTLDWSGGRLVETPRLGLASTMNITGLAFSLDGNALTDLPLGTPSEIPAPGEMLTGILADGSPFELDLSDLFSSGSPSGDAPITLTLVEPLLGDLNLDGFVGADDLDILLGVWNQGVEPGSTGDLTGDGFIGAGDLDILLGVWNTGTPLFAAAVPEPGVALPLLAGVLAAAARRRGR